ncbi:MAG: hypothetical protein EBT26_01985 [Microbacteriaceae bacterium]|nr:hypothetical protein [Microbacteriaceae bacterium]
MTTEVIVTEKNNQVVIERKEPQVIVAGLMGPNSSITGLTDVDLSNLTDGGLLVYRTLVQKWVATTTLDAQNMEGGYY